MHIEDDSIFELSDAFYKSYNKLINVTLSENETLIRYGKPKMFRDFFQSELERRIGKQDVVAKTTAYLKFKIGNILFIIDNCMNEKKETKKRTEYIGQGLLFSEEELDSLQKELTCYLIYDIREDSLSLDMVPVNTDIQAVNIFRGIEDLKTKIQQFKELMSKEGQFEIKKDEVKENKDFKLRTIAAEEKANG